MRKHSAVAVILICGALILSTFQNCSQANYDFGNAIATSATPLAEPDEFLQTEMSAPITEAPTTTAGQSMTTTTSPTGFSLSNAQVKYGLIGDLWFLKTEMASASPSMVNAYFSTDISEHVETPLILPSLAVPITAFKDGFVQADGTRLMRPSLDPTTPQEPLMEFFAIDVKSNIMLTKTDEPGYYTFALMSDDGAILYRINSTATQPTGASSTGMATNTTSETVMINNDGKHAPTLKCATAPIDMKAGAFLPVRLRYYQGPRYYIALSLYWKFSKTQEAATDTLCDRQVTSTDMKAFETRGWNLLKSENFVVPIPMPTQIPGTTTSTTQ